MVEHFTSAQRVMRERRREEGRRGNRRDEGRGREKRGEVQVIKVHTIHERGRGRRRNR